MRLKLRTYATRGVVLFLFYGSLRSGTIQHHADNTEQNGGQENKQKLVLYWHGPGLADIWDMGLGNHCNNRCRFTDDRSLLPLADAVIVEKNLFYNLKRLPRRHNSRQIFVASQYEPPAKYGDYSELYRQLSSRMSLDYFNLTLCYKQDSDVIIKYHNFLPRLGLNDDLNLPKDEPRKMAVWLVSHCETPMKRESLVKQLQDYGVSVDIYGRCGKSLLNTCSHKDSKNVTGKDPYCMEKLVRNYKFYFAFENSLCEDYLSEKPAHFMTEPTIPVVMSYAKLKQILPQKSYIDIFDFKTVKSLADYILYLDRNFDEYLSYFRWKRHWRVETLLDTRPRIKCDLCDLLHTDYHKTYHSLADWIAAPDECDMNGLETHFTDWESGK